MVFLGFGIIGTFLPGLPGGPFYLIASFCFARSSKKIDAWFKSTIFYQKYVLAIKKNHGMTKKEKIRINLIADFFIIVSLFMFEQFFIQCILVILGVIKHYYFIKIIPTISPEEEKEWLKNLQK